MARSIPSLHSERFLAVDLLRAQTRPKKTSLLDRHDMKLQILRRHKSIATSASFGYEILCLKKLRSPTNIISRRLGLTKKESLHDFATV